MKTLVVYYSRTEKTEQIAKMIQKELGSDIESINPKKNYKGPIGFMKGGFEASSKRLSNIEEPKNNVSDYDLVIIGTPVWASTMASPVRSYLMKNEGKFNKVALFATAGGSGIESTLEDMGSLTKEPIETLGVTKAELPEYETKTQNFINNIKEKLEL